MAAERFINKKNGRVATVERRDEKCGTVILMYEDGQGGTTVTTATLKRWWKKVQEEEVEAAEPVVNTESNEDVCGDGTPYTQVMKEIVKGAEKKAKAAKAAKAESKKATKKKEPKEKKERLGVDVLLGRVSDILDGSGVSVKQYDSMPRSLALCINDKSFSNLYLGNSKCVLKLPTSLVPEGYTPSVVRNCPLAAAFDIDYNDLSLLQDLLGQVVDYKNSTKL